MDLQAKRFAELCAFLSRSAVKTAGYFHTSRYVGLGHSRIKICKKQADVQIRN